MSKQSPIAAAGQGDQPTRKRIERRHQYDNQMVTFYLAHEPLVPLRRGGRLQKFSAAEILTELEYRRAFEGHARDLESIFWKDSQNTKFSAWRSSYEWPEDTRPKRALKRRQADVRAVTEVLLLLDMAVVDAVGHIEAKSDWRAATIWPVHLQEWVADAAPHKAREGAYYEIQMERVSKTIATYRTEESVLRDSALALLAAARAPGATRFEKGVSGNPTGRPRKRLGTLPFPYLTEVVVMTLNGRRRELSRMEALLYHLQTQAMKGDVKLARILERMMKKYYWKDWLQPVIIFDRDTGLPRREYKLTNDHERPPVFESLRVLGVCSARARSSLRLEPWVVEMALGRLPARALTAEQQQLVLSVTSKPKQVKWPAWWELP